MKKSPLQPITLIKVIHLFNSCVCVPVIDARFSSYVDKKNGSVCFPLGFFANHEAPRIGEFSVGVESCLVMQMQVHSMNSLKLNCINNVSSLCFINS